MLYQFVRYVGKIAFIQKELKLKQGILFCTSNCTHKYDVYSFCFFKKYKMVKQQPNVLLQFDIVMSPCFSLKNIFNDPL